LPRFKSLILGLGVECSTTVLPGHNQDSPNLTPTPDGNTPKPNNRPKLG
jgi:hypothetical protein